MNINCHLIKTDGHFKVAIMPVEFVSRLAESLAKNKTEVIHFKNETVEIEGIYISGKGSKTQMLLIPCGDDEV